MRQEDEQEKEVDQPGKDTIRDRDDFWRQKGERLRSSTPFALQLCFPGGSVRALWHRWTPPCVFIFCTFVPVFRWFLMFLVCIWWFLPTTDSASSRFSPSVVFRLVAILVSCPGWCSQSFLGICLPICSSRLYTCLLAFVMTNRETQVGSWGPTNTKANTSRWHWEPQQQTVGKKGEFAFMDSWHDAGNHTETEQVEQAKSASPELKILDLLFQLRNIFLQVSHASDSEWKLDFAGSNNGTIVWSWQYQYLSLTRSSVITSSWHLSLDSSLLFFGNLLSQLLPE